MHVGMHCSSLSLLWIQKGLPSSISLPNVITTYHLILHPNGSAYLEENIEVVRKLTAC